MTDHNDEIPTNGSDELVDAVSAISEEIRTTRDMRTPVNLGRAQRKATPEILLWNVIRKSTEALSFKNYKPFMDFVLCQDKDALRNLVDNEEAAWGPKARKFLELGGNGGQGGRRFLPFNDTDSYRLLKVATEAFLIVNCGVGIEDSLTEEEYDQILALVDASDIGGMPVTEWWNRYRTIVNGQEGYVMPYLFVIWNKLEEAPIRSRIFNNSRSSINPGRDQDAERCYSTLMEKIFQPCLLELIWSYWHEEGMLVQTMNALSRRFQNIRGPLERDPLAMVELDPLRPLNNLLWGYIQDEQHRLTVVRRAYEYDHHYGLTLEGKAVPALKTADSRSRFLESFHQLLHQTWSFYKQDDDTTVIADGFPVLNALKDLHMVLSEGAHNQYGDLPTTARIEMLMQQWLLSRPEFREALPGRTMVAYPEPWMERVDGMKKLQGWTDTNVLHFRNLGVYGEQLLLTARFTAWNDIDDADMGATWARCWRNQILGYIHAYRTVTGVDLTVNTSSEQQQSLIAAQPSALLSKRSGNGRAAQGSPPPGPAYQSFRQRKQAKAEQVLEKRKVEG